MKPKEVKGIKCPHCMEFIKPKDIGGVVKIKNAIESRWQCGECEELYDNKDEAKECCKE